MKRLRFFVSGFLCAALFLALRFAAAGESTTGPTPVSIGAKIFADPTLSASGELACATCHDPAHAHAQGNDLPVQLGGKDRDAPGFRAVPSLRYASFTPSFHYDDEGTPIGGFNRDGRVRLDLAELRGLAWFNRPDKGNCAACHPSARGPSGDLPLFTDFSYDNLGVPRNAAIPATADPGYFDLGLCGPDRVDLAERSDLCGAFKVPTLRNVATRHVFFHNGRFATLREALAFYVHRDTDAAFYSRDTNGDVRRFHDLPPELAENVNTAEVPYDRKRGQAPRLTEAELADLEAFLNTLTDGYRLPR